MQNKWEVRYSAEAFGVCFEQWFTRKIVKLIYILLEKYKQYLFLNQR